MTYSRVLIFDVETTGLLPKYYEPQRLKLYKIHNLPHIIQLSFMVYDFTIDKIVKKYNAYIKVPVDIPEEITRLTGINKEKTATIGVDIKEALVEFYQAYVECDCVIAHNLKFDRNMILIELERQRENFATLEIFKMFDSEYNKSLNIALECTMNLTRDYCNIQRTNTTGSYIKFPTLTELHNKLFDETPENMHNSLMDILICLKCYLKFKHNIAIPEPYYKNILQEIQHEIC
tara:strand:- start:1992 stop:2690 length:699 start_codon:yes stop_codon:yes gene_type:complete